MTYKVSSWRQDKSILLKQLSAIGNILLNATNMKGHQIKDFPNFYKVCNHI